MQGIANVRLLFDRDLSMLYRITSVLWGTLLALICVCAVLGQEDGPLDSAPPEIETLLDEVSSNTVSNEEATSDAATIAPEPLAQAEEENLVPEVEANVADEAAEEDAAEEADEKEVPVAAVSDLDPWGTRVYRAMAYLHPATVHFPIALLVVGALAGLLSYFTGSRAQSFAFYCLVLGTFFLVLSTAMGWSYAVEKYASDWTERPTVDDDESVHLLDRHRWMGVASSVVSIVLTLIAFVSAVWPKSGIRHLWKLGLVALAALVSIVGHQGGELVHGDLLEEARQIYFGEE